MGAEDLKYRPQDSAHDGFRATGWVGTPFGVSARKAPRYMPALKAAVTTFERDLERGPVRQVVAEARQPGGDDHAAAEQAEEEPGPSSCT